MTAQRHRKDCTVRKNLGAAWLLACTLAAGTTGALASGDEVTPEQMINAMEATFGITPGERRNHTKGSCAAGEFTGNPEAASYSRSALFSGAKIPVIARFSLGGGNPHASDAAQGVRGMALEFRLPDGGLQHMTMLDAPVFGAAKVRTFFDMIIAIRPDPATGKPSPAKIDAFRASHPDSLAQASFLQNHNPPASYANSAYFGIHTFRFVDKQGRIAQVRWRFVPADGEKSLTDAELKSMPRDFLEQALIERTKRGPLRWDMIVALGEPGDSEDDPSQAWPENRRQIRAGTLTITSATAQKGAECENINFDPLVMSDGIAASSDPILLFRSPAYAYSYARRIAGK